MSASDAVDDDACAACCCLGQRVLTAAVLTSVDALLAATFVVASSLTQVSVDVSDTLRLAENYVLLAILAHTRQNIVCIVLKRYCAEYCSNAFRRPC